MSRTQGMERAALTRLGRWSGGSSAGQGLELGLAGQVHPPVGQMATEMQIPGPCWLWILISWD